MAGMFRLLRADEIEVRIGNLNQTKTKANLLLYKDARCDQAVLDETVGPFNWKREHSRDNANCAVSIWDEKKEQWIIKEDTGTKSKMDAEKGIASDSFKRACVNWGIGRELYSAPNIWVNYDPKKYEEYMVAEIGYNEKQEINKLAIADKTGIVIFRYGATTKNHVDIKTDPAPDDVGDERIEEQESSNDGNFDFKTQRAKASNNMEIGPKDFQNIHETLKRRGSVSKKDPDNQADFDNLCEEIKKVIPEYQEWVQSRITA